METPTINAIEAHDLAQLQDIELRRGKLYTDLGGITHQIRALEAQRDKMHDDLDQIDREYMRFSNRMTTKYQLNENTKVNLQTGIIEE